MRKKIKPDLDEVKADEPQTGPVQSFDPGSTGRPRKRHIREEQTIKEGAKVQLDKMKKGLRY